MKITLITEASEEIPLRLPYDGSEYVVADGKRCECGGDPLTVCGARGTDREDDRGMIEAAAICARCRGILGTIRIEIQTLFGLEEDRRVLNGRPRVY